LIIIRINFNILFKVVPFRARFSVDIIYSIIERQGEKLILRAVILLETKFCKENAVTNINRFAAVEFVTQCVKWEET